MYTIVMDKHKNLNTTVRTTLFQKESMVDKIQFLIPPTYNGIELNNYTAILKYVDPNGNFHSEKLIADEETYKNYLRYTIDVKSNLTHTAGVVTIRLSFLDVNGESDEEISKLETNSTSIEIQKPGGFNDAVIFEDIKSTEIQFIEFN